jgi:hypothetical protein
MYHSGCRHVPLARLRYSSRHEHSPPCGTARRRRPFRAWCATGPLTSNCGATRALIQEAGLSPGGCRTPWCPRGRGANSIKRLDVGGRRSARRTSKKGPTQGKGGARPASARSSSHRAACTGTEPDGRAPRLASPLSSQGLAPCGAERDRTVGLLSAIQALSQLSYSPRGPIARADGNLTEGDRVCNREFLWLHRLRIGDVGRRQGDT